MAGTAGPPTGAPTNSTAPFTQGFVRSPPRLRVPIEPPPTSWQLPDPAGSASSDLVAVGADLEPGTVLAAYRRGMFPMPLTEDVLRQVPGAPSLGWWSPDPRGIIPLDALHVSRSLRTSLPRFEMRVDTAFDEVLEACGDPSRPYGWISPEITAAYRRLFELGWVHSVEAWSRDDGRLAGGLYGVAINGLFAGESMFHRRTDASKAALVTLVRLLDAAGFQLLDVQWTTPHLASLGAVDVPRPTYLSLLREALRAQPAPLPTGPLAL